MTITADVLDAMIAAGCTAKQLAAAVRADEKANAERLAKKREQNRIRQRNHRERNARNALQSVTERDPLSPEGLPPTPPNPKPLSPIPPSPPKGGSSPTLKAEFDAEFWPAYPNKVGKPEALKAFLKARHRAPLESIMAGLDAYRHKTDDRPWCNPSTFLNQDRWNDQPAPRPQAQAPPREPTFAEFLKEKAQRMEVEDNARTIEATRHDHGNRDSPFRALYGPATPQGKA